jgi:hypothetical protein
VLDVRYAPRISVPSHNHRDRIEEALETIGSKRPAHSSHPARVATPDRSGSAAST